jgi:hypothetical protein
VISPDARHRPGRKVAELLAGAWRLGVAACDSGASGIEEAESLLLGSGAGPLAFFRSPEREKFREAYRLSALHAVVREERTLAAVEYLRSRCIEPVVIKGWAMARLYPEPACRPYADVDLCVSPADYEKAADAVAGAPREAGPIDLHRPFARRTVRSGSLRKFADELRELDDREWDDVFQRSRLIPAGSGAVRVPCPEDHLRLLCLHYLRHGGFRPLWLCDVAVAIETRSEPFDWDRLFGGDPWRATCVSVVFGLSRDLLGADLKGVPEARIAGILPARLIPAVLHEWETPYRWPGKRPLAGPYLLRHPWLLFREIFRRWPGPIESTVNLKAPFDGVPRFPLQIAALVLRFPELVRQLGEKAPPAPAARPAR